MKFMKYLLATAMCLLVSTACSNNKKSGNSENESTEAEVQAEPAKSGGKTLIVYFSHAGDNYAVGNIKVGNTKIVADYIAELIGADQFEIKTDKYDGMAYKPLCDLAKKEQENGELPPYEGDIDVSQYETIFIGGPVWWGTYPQVMFTFLKNGQLLAGSHQTLPKSHRQTRSCHLWSRCQNQQRPRRAVPQETGLPEIIAILKRCPQL